LILVTSSGAKKPRLFIKFYTDHREFVYIKERGKKGTGKWGEGRREKKADS